MFIDPATGTISIDGTVFATRSTTRREFEQSEWFKSARPMVKNPPWMSYGVKGLRPAGSELSYAVAVYFEDQALKIIDIIASAPGDPTSWNDSTIDNETAIKKRHDALLEEWLGAPHEVYNPLGERAALNPVRAVLDSTARYDFEWGKVTSAYDDRAGYSSIGIRYQ